MDAIDKLKHMSKTRPNAVDWHHNIITAHALCKTERDYKLFHLYLSNPEGFQSERVDDENYKTLGDIIDNMTDIQKEEHVIKPYPSYMNERITLNGNQVIIDVTNTGNDEKETS
jgi:hypothetical protein